MTGVIPDIGPDSKVQVTMEYNGDTPVRITSRTPPPKEPRTHDFER